MESKYDITVKQRSFPTEALHSKRFPETTEPQRRICFIQQSYPPRKKGKERQNFSQDSCFFPEHFIITFTES